MNDLKSRDMPGGITEKHFQRFEIGFRTSLMPDQVAALNNAEIAFEDRGSYLGMKVKTWLLAGVHPKVNYCVDWPATPWEHFKESYAPFWFRRRWPVRYTERKFVLAGSVNVCPHANVPWPDKSHMDFMDMTQKEVAVKPEGRHHK